MDDCTLHRNHLHHHGGTPASEESDDDELDLEKALLCRRHRPAVSSPSLDLDSATLHNHKKTLCTCDDLQEEGSAEDPTCEMSLSTMETEYGLEGLQLPQQHQPPRYGGRHSSLYEPDGSSSFTELAFASMDMDRHGGPLRGDINTTEHSRYRHNHRYARSNSSYPNDRSNDSSSYCDGMGESMFGESFALDDGSPSFDVEAHQQQRAAASSFQASRSQLLTCSAVDEE
jgi:hypothetical protein